MLEKPTDVLTMFPIRKNKGQKRKFCETARGYGEALGYICTEEKSPFGARNLIFGDPERANYLVTAHYDTPARLPFPNFITPCNIGIYVLYQLAVTAALLLPCMILGVLVALLTEEPIWTTVVVYVSLLAVLGLMICGPANKSNANDNTSGVILVLEMMKALPIELRDKVCFVLFDLEEAGLVGSMSYRGKHKQASNNQVVFNADCVGAGDEILFIPGKELRKKQRERVERWKALCPVTGEKSITIQDRGICFYPSDQANFPWGVGIAAFRRHKAIGLYCNRIHTPKDTICEINNVILIRDMLIRIIEKGN